MHALPWCKLVATKSHCAVTPRCAITPIVLSQQRKEPSLPWCRELTHRTGGGGCRTQGVESHCAGEGKSNLSHGKKEPLHNILRIYGCTCKGKSHHNRGVESRQRPERAVTPTGGRSHPLGVESQPSLPRCRELLRWQKKVSRQCHSGGESCLKKSLYLLRRSK